MRTKSTSGPDKLLPCMLFEAKDELTVPTHSLFQLCWGKGQNPVLWNCDNKIYIGNLKACYISSGYFRNPTNILITSPSLISLLVLQALLVKR